MNSIYRIALLAALLFCWGPHGNAASPAATSPSPAASPKKETSPTKAAKPSGKKATARELVTAANKSLGALIKAGRAEKDLDPKVAKNKPFWGAVKKVSINLDRAEKGLATKNNDFFDGVADARAATREMKVAWQLTNSKNKDMSKSAKALGDALAVLRTDYSKEAARKKKGGDLTADEKAQLAKIKAQQKELQAKMKALEAKATKDKALQHGLKEIKERARKVEEAPDTVAGLIAALYALDELEGLINGYDPYVNRDWRVDWVSIDTLVDGWEPLEIALVVPYDWADLDLPVELDTDDLIDPDVNLTPADLDDGENFVESGNFDPSDAEDDEIAAEQDNDPEIDADDSEDDDSMDDPSDDDGADFDGDGDDDSDDEGEDEGEDSDDDGGEDEGDDGGGDGDE